METGRVPNNAPLVPHYFVYVYFENGNPGHQAAVTLDQIINKDTITKKLEHLGFLKDHASAQEIYKKVVRGRSFNSTVNLARKALNGSNYYVHMYSKGIIVVVQQDITEQDKNRLNSSRRFLKRGSFGLPMDQEGL